MKWLLLFCFLIPFNLFAEIKNENHGSWITMTVIDDFTDEVFIQTKAYDIGDMFSFYIKNPNWGLSVELKMPLCEPSKPREDNSIPIMFRIGKNEVITIPMKTLDPISFKVFIIDWEALKETELTQLIIMSKLLPEMYRGEEKGETLKVRIKDEICNKTQDLKFSLDGFVEAYTPAANEFLKQMGSLEEYFLPKE